MVEKELQQFIVQVAGEAGEYLRNHFYTFKNVIDHDSGARLTNSDVELAGIIRKRITRVYPDHRVIIVGDHMDASAAEYTWIVDPLEGSNHFLRNIPMYTFNIALQKNGETIAAAVGIPQTNQLLYAFKGTGAYLNGLRTYVSGETDVAKAYVFVELPESKFRNQPNNGHGFDTRFAVVKSLAQNVGQLEILRVGSFGLCLVAAGSFDAYVDLSGSSQALSQQAALLIVREAGGEIVELEKPQNGFTSIMVANKILSESLGGIINSRK